MAGITALGTGSGIDFESMVAKLSAASRAPANRLNSKISESQTDISAYGKIKAAATALADAAKKLSKAEAQDKLRGLAISASDATIISASRSGTIPPTEGTHSVSISAMAAAHSVASQAVADQTADLGGGTLTISLGTITGGTLDPVTKHRTGSSFAQAASETFIIPAGAGISAIASEINSKSSAVSASVVFDGSGYRLAIVTKETGNDRGIKLSGTGAPEFESFFAHDPQGSQSFIETQTASNLGATINGVSVSSKNNTINGALGGISIEAKKTGSSTVAVAKDQSTVSAALTELATAWNNLHQLISDATAYDRDGIKTGPLSGETAAKSLLNTARNAMQKTSAGADNGFQTLSSVGLVFDSKGKLSVNSATLTKTLAANPNAVANLFSSSAGNFGATAGGIVESYSESAISSRVSGLKTAISSMQKQKEAILSRSSTDEQTLRARFSALDRMLSQLNQTSSFLAKQLG